ncbi:malonate decarboxylase holo-ACP synthase [Paenibacillus sp. HW567]|uniref:malonate decarboxylase holo-ACP synthase n=1 Tax=Paenibacillus sp. HW567 TaxID=1034769 RepID=UPI0003805012|nr:malonate decarboxylase holo-ACP synthase [Paenibacillus sp. HW567]
MVIRPHDLIEVSDLSYLVMDEEREWVTTSLLRTPFVVVRRAERYQDGSVPVGIRGAQRNQREPAFLAPQGIGRIISPYEIAENRMWKVVPAERQALPVLRIMDQVAELMTNWRWGPTGSAGFELVTGTPSLKETSDLDLVIDWECHFNFETAANLLYEFDQLEARIDIQVECAEGAYILREIIDSRAETVVLRTPLGPKLVRSPWR